MKKLLVLLLLAIALTFPSHALAQPMMGSVSSPQVGSISDDHTAQGEAEGKVLWESLQTKGLGCENLSDEDFHALGMYFMGLMVGDSHEAMDTMMTQMMGEEGEDQMHIAMGKRMSGCDSDAVLPQSMMGGGIMPMMSMMMGGGGNTMGYSWNNMMGWGGTGSFLFTLTWVVWLVVGILAAVWLIKQIRKK